MDPRPPTPRGQREPRPPREDYQQRTRSRREEPPRSEAAYQSYRQRQSHAPVPAVEDVLEELATLQHAVAQLASNQPAKNEVLEAIHTLEASFTRKLANYYPAEVIEAKLQERAQILQTVRGELEEVRQKALVARSDEQVLTRTFLRAFWATWQARAVVISCLILAGIFTGVVIIDIIQAALRR